MATHPHTPQDAPSLDAYLGKLNPIPLNGRYPDPKCLEDWAAGAFDWLYQGDPLAENAARALRQHGSRGKVADRIQQLANQGDPACTALLADMHDIPGWVDFDLMRRGGAMAQRHFPMLVLALTYGCMPLTFAHPDAAEVFASTGRLEANIARRLNESGTLFFGVCNSDALAPGKHMWEACVQVRLVHAIVRMSLLERGWNVAERGVPISQLATAAGPAFFGTHLLGCLRRVGARITDEEAEGHCMIWRYTTRLLGVPQALLGHTQAEQDDIDLNMSSLFFAPDDTARVIMAALIRELARQPPTARIPAALQLALFRRMLGDEMANAYGIPENRKGERLLGGLDVLLSGYGRLQGLSPLAGLLRRRGQQIIEHFGTEGLVSLDVAGTRQ